LKFLFNERGLGKKNEGKPKPRKKPKREWNEEREQERTLRSIQ
jgi:hypothetical protein